MDVQYDVPEVFSSIGQYPDNYYVVQVDNWGVTPMRFTPDKIRWLWDEMSKYRTLFNDYTVGDVENFVKLITTLDSYWLEVVDIQTCIPVGVVYLLDIERVVDPSIHLIFFDRKLTDKVDLCKEIARHIFGHFPIHRLTATLPVIYHATIRLAKRVGFVQEGETRESQYMGGKYVNEVILGLLESEV